MLSLAFILLFSTTLFAKSQVTSTKEYSDVFQTVLDKSAQYGASNVLVVFDIDDTLLVTPECRRPDGTWARGNTKLFVCPTFHTEDDLSLKIDEAQQDGISTIALTARGNVLIEATQRELARLHDGALALDFKGHPFNKDLESIQVPKTKSCKRGETPPCLSGKFTTFPKFVNGVMYANGANKGLSLKALLKDLGKNYKSIIFVDDNRKNTDNVNAVYKKEDNVDMEVFLYLRHRK